MSSLYRKYRPKSWAEVIGQNHIVRTLINQISSGNVGHAYLFTGTRGTGKTSSAKIFAKAINCTDNQKGEACGKCLSCIALSDPASVDIVEMDAASNNGVDEIRELRESVQYLPVSCKYKVYIVDEVHMLSISAFNALLKTLEEPPAHVVFILATTEVHKLPRTILSRCTRFDFRLVSKTELQEFLQRIFKKEGYEFETSATELIALHAEGSVRDALSLADMCRSFAPKKLTYEATCEVLGTSGFATLLSLSEALISGNTSAVLELSNELSERGKSVSSVNKELCDFFSKLISIKNIKDYRSAFNNEEHSKALELASSTDNYRLGRIMEILALTENQLRYSTQQKIIFDAFLIKATELKTENSLEAVLSRLSALETAHSAQRTAHNEGNILNNSTTNHQSPITNHQPPTTNHQPPITNHQPPTTNHQSSLASRYKPVQEEAPVFATADEADDYNAKNASINLAGMLITKLRHDKHTHLYQSLRNEENISINGKALVFTPSTAGAVGALSDSSNLKILNLAIKELMGNDFSVEANIPKIASADDYALLNGLFGDKLIDKNKK
ncbi:MAG: DNA polymerase III subunit gamma/tau [Firmicutes bacterium]|nr:DNA polymerase III subunit gamma/tau [Bacillota bacterium]